MFISSRKNTRYFVLGQYSLVNKYTPGKLSGELLEALGLPENGIPVHVYRMREIGYPRGWIDEAKVEYSGISIFTAPNKCNYKSIFDFIFVFFVLLSQVYFNYSNLIYKLSYFNLLIF